VHLLFSMMRQRRKEHGIRKIKRWQKSKIFGRRKNAVCKHESKRPHFKPCHLKTMWNPAWKYTKMGECLSFRGQGWTKTEEKGESLFSPVYLETSDRAAAAAIRER